MLKLREFKSQGTGRCSVLLSPALHPHLQGLTEPHCLRNTLGDVLPRGQIDVCQAQQLLYAEPLVQIQIVVCLQTIVSLICTPSYPLIIPCGNLGLLSASSTQIFLGKEKVD